MAKNKNGLAEPGYFGKSDQSEKQKYSWGLIVWKILRLHGTKPNGKAGWLIIVLGVITAAIAVARMVIAQANDPNDALERMLLYLTLAGAELLVGARMVGAARRSRLKGKIP